MPEHVTLVDNLLLEVVSGVNRVSGVKEGSSAYLIEINGLSSPYFHCPPTTFSFLNGLIGAVIRKSVFANAACL